MLAKNHSYFDVELCLDGHYIVTGYTNDQFCNDLLQLTDVKFELHNYLRHSQGFDAVFFLDGVDMLFCYDQQSFDILQGHQPQSAAPPAQGQEIIATTPLGRRRRRRGAAPQEPAPAPAAHGAGGESPLHMGRRQLDWCWQQVTALLRRSNYRCALVLGNVDSLQNSMGTQEMAVLEELQSYHSVNHSIVLYLFRDTAVSNLIENARQNRSSGSRQWATFVQTVLLGRIETGNAATNRVISLRTPNAREMQNLLNRLRLRPERPLDVRAEEIRDLSGQLAASCARQRWSLNQMQTRLERYLQEHPQRTLGMDTWREFTGEESYLPAMEQLDALIGLEKVKRDIREWYALQKKQLEGRSRQPEGSSRFTPLPAVRQAYGHSLNVRLKGSPGTGKTTVARLMGMLYYELGLLAQGQLIERSAGELISQYVGGTARLVRKAVQEAMGGVLFIDEAYALLTNQHGIEAINQLVNDMSTYEGQFCVVLAGYAADIDRLMRENDGLARRIPTEYVLEDYSPQEMQQILRQMAARDPDHVTISPALAERLDDFCEAWVGGRTRGWGNAGEAQNLLTAMKKRCSIRTASEGNLRRGLSLRPEDIPENLRHCLAPRSKDLEEAFSEIDKMIGLANVKRFLRDLSRNILWGAEDKAPGNYIFSGPPGTGKTTVARRMGEILGHLGVLRRKTNNVVECKAADLLNGAVTLQDAVADARGGILFIDEAHQLAMSDHGRAIIRELVPLIEDPEIHADTCFICAGYAVEMRQFLEVDDGMPRRFPANHRIRFDDYTADELVQILAFMAQERGERASEGYLARSRTALERFLEHRPANFGNGGFIRDVYLPDSVVARTARLNRKATGSDDGLVTQEQVTTYTEEERRTLTELDLPQSFVRYAGPVGQKPPAPRSAGTLLDELYGKEEIVRFVRSRCGDEEETFYDGDTNVGLHYAIAGAQGSGRHTAVRAVAAAWKEAGYLQRDDVQFAGKADLEAGYVGQTAIKTQNVISHALGGTLVIEYPSALLPKNASDNSFGPDVLGVIAGAMTTHFDDLCVVFLDTQDGMQEFFRAFPSVRGNLCRQFEIEDLSPEDMRRIFELKTRDGMVFEEELEQLLPDFFLNWVSDRGGLGESVRSWGNGDEVDRLADELIQNWKQGKGKTDVREVQEEGSSYTLRRRLITREMFPEKLQRYLTSNRVVSETAMQELEAMTGLHRVKQSIRAIERRIRRMSRGHVSPGLYCYLGNPGVGKTTVAKLMGGILRATGVLTQGHVIVRTARQMSDNLEEFESTVKLAKNGILFIDEAHQLAEHPLGRSVIKRLLTVLEDPAVTRDTCIILAGYPNDMMRLLEMDSGLSSRFGTKDSMIVFEDYTPQELLLILDDMAKNAAKIPQIGSDYPLRLDPGYRERSLEVFQAVTAAGNPNFGNARFVRNYLHDSLDELLERLDEEYGVQDDPPTDVVDLLTLQDVPARFRQIGEEQRRRIRIPASLVQTASPGRITRETYADVCAKLSQGVVLIEVYRDGRKFGEGTGSIVTAQGHILTCAHVLRDAQRIRARVFAPGMIGGDYHWFDCEKTVTSFEDCDMAVAKMKGTNFFPLALRGPRETIGTAEETLLIGYPLGAMLTGNRTENLKMSVFDGRIASAQSVRGVDRYYIDTTGLHGNSGSPVFSKEDGRVIGVFSGSIIPRGENNLDELNYFYPIRYFWEKYAVDAGSEEEEG